MSLAKELNVWVDLITPFLFFQLCVRSRVRQPHRPPLLLERGHHSEHRERQQISHELKFVNLSTILNLFRFKFCSNISLKTKYAFISAHEGPRAV